MPSWIPLWIPLVVVACLVVLTAVSVRALIALARAVRRMDTVLGIVEQELRPMIGQAHALADEAQMLTREVGLEIKRLGEATERINTVAEGLARVIGALASLTRAGQVIGLAAGLKRGLDVFLQRYRREGERHE
jgi:hypothetical protein